MDHLVDPPERNYIFQNALFGNGVYLSTDPGLALGYSRPARPAWPAGPAAGKRKVSAVLLCEVIDAPEVKLKLHDDPERSRVRGSEGGPVPERYLVVRNDDLIAPRFLLVYSEVDVVADAGGGSNRYTD